MEGILWAAAIVCMMLSGGLYFRIHLEVMIAAPPKSKRPFKNFLETFDNNRIFREHKRLYPHSSARAKYWLLFLAGIFLFLAAVGISTSNQ